MSNPNYNGNINTGSHAIPWPFFDRGEAAMDYSAIHRLRHPGVLTANFIPNTPTLSGELRDPQVSRSTFLDPYSVDMNGSQSMPGRFNGPEQSEQESRRRMDAQLTRPQQINLAFSRHCWTVFTLDDPPFKISRPDLMRPIALQYARSAPLFRLSADMGKHLSANQLIVFQVLCHGPWTEGRSEITLVTADPLLMPPEIFARIRSFDVNGWRGLISVHNVSEPLAHDGLPVLGGFVFARAVQDPVSKDWVLQQIEPGMLEAHEELRRRGTWDGFAMLGYVHGQAGSSQM